MDAQVPAELKLLGAAAVVGLVQVLWGAAAARGQQDLAWAAGPRDEPRPITGVAARLDRALKNFLETFPLFAAALLGCVAAGRLGPLTLWGSGLYVIARALYVPLYASGAPVVRSVVWGVSVAGLIMVLVALLK